MLFFRNWFLPTLLAGLGAGLGLIVIGLPGFNMVQTIDGSPVVGGYIPPEQVSTIINQGKNIGSYLDFYGMRVPGEPFYWVIGIIVALAYIGYRIGVRFRVGAAE
ncbi:hypothetical protein ABVB72_25445 [Rhizobium nepotum]|uniref:hypothetical protein n=1 Tax=Rhizobium nepotum TaxID=1035271 RepID=UPI00336AB84B